MERLDEGEIRRRLERYPKIHQYFSFEIIADVNSCCLEENTLAYNIRISNDVFLKRVEDCLKNLENVKGLRNRINYYEKNIREMRSFISEIIEASYLKNKGCEIEFIPEAKKRATPDFRIRYNNRWIDFEIKTFINRQGEDRLSSLKKIFEIKKGEFIPEGPLVKIGRKIGDAYRQLKSDDNNPKIIALYTYDITIVPELIKFNLCIPQSECHFVNGIVFYSLGTSVRFLYMNNAVSKEMYVNNLKTLLTDSSD